MRLKKFKIGDAFYFIRTTKSSVVGYGWFNGNLTKTYRIQGNNSHGRVSYFSDANFKKFYI
jgi:hypothetical protein